MQSVAEVRSVLQLLKTNEQKDSAQISFPGNESDDDGFYLVEDNDYKEVNDFNSFPWLEPNHQLYFPATLGNDTNRATRWDAVDMFSVENWYSHLKKHTFQSRFITLNHDDIQHLIGNNPPEYDSTKLERIFNDVLSEFYNKEAFMRLSTRSPKDSKYLFDEASTLMSNDFSYWKENENKHQQLVSFVTSMLKAMKIKDGRKIIEVIAESPRVYSDLLSLLNSVEKSNCTTKVIFTFYILIRPLQIVSTF